MFLINRVVNQEIILSLDGYKLGRIVVTEISGKKVTLGFELDKDVEIKRKELDDKQIKEQTGEGN